MTTKNHSHSWWLAARCGDRHHGASSGPFDDGLQRAVDLPKLGGRGSSRPGRRSNTGSVTMPRNAGPDAGHREVDPHRHRPTPRADANQVPTGPRPRRSRLVRHSTNAWVRPRASTRSGRKLSANPASAPAAISASVRSRPGRCASRTPNTTLQRPSATAPSHASADRPIGVSTSSVTVTAETAARRMTPRPGERVDAEDDAEVLQQAEAPLALQRVPEHLVPAHQHVQRTRTVEVQEVDVGHVAGEHPLREDEHEALFHRAAGAEVQAAQRDRARPP
jgi:hypothetical protein